MQKEVQFAQIDDFAVTRASGSPDGFHQAVRNKGFIVTGALLDDFLDEYVRYMTTLRMTRVNLLLIVWRITFTVPASNHMLITQVS